MRKKALQILFLVWAGAAPVIALYWASVIRAHKKNGFIRQFRGVISGHAKRIELPSASYYLSGCTTDQIFLGNNSRSAELLKTSFDFSHTTSLIVPVADSVTFAWGAAKIFTVFPDLLFTEGITPGILSYDLTNARLNRLAISPTHFDLIVPLNRSSFCFRTIDESTQSNILAKEIAGQDKTLLSRDLLKNQQDGQFSTDGMLLYDSTISSVVYVYAYRNEYITCDTNLVPQGNGRTIDTTSYAQIHIGKIESEHKEVFSVPPLQVNKHAAVDKGLLFIYSGLKADNEDINQFERYSVIDVYSLKEKRYRYSFSVPDYNKQGISEFMVYNNLLILLKGRDLVVYHLAL